MKSSHIAILHYTAPPVVGGVEAVIEAHMQVFDHAGYAATVIAGRGAQERLAPVADFISIPEIDSQHPEIIEINSSMEKGAVPPNFSEIVDTILVSIAPVISQFDHLIVHNVFTKHFNLPLTAALHRLLDRGLIHHCIAWCHDFTWTSPSSRSKVHPGYPWDLLRTQRDDVTYVVVSKRRQQELAALFGCPLDQVKVVYNGVEPSELLGLSSGGLELIHRLGLLEGDLNLLMPVRVTQAKNIEYALHVVAALKARGLRLKLLLTGPPDPHDPQSMHYYQSLRDLRRQLDVEKEMRFVFEAGPDPDRPHFIDNQTVGDLFRVSDVMFMPSHREGFGMPVIEAGLAGIPVVSTDVPASAEIASDDVTIFDPGQDPETTAEQIIHLVESNPISRLRREVRKNFTWEAIFRQQIEPLLRS